MLPKKTTAVIVELNPFHNGHEYFIKEAKKRSKDNYLIALVSLINVQRGEITVLDPLVKAKHLLEIGVDLVVANPLIYTNQGGEYFGFNSVNILNYFNVDEIICGSETNDIEIIKTAFNNQDLIEMSKFANKNDFKSGYLKKELNELKSNDILALSYFKGINKINPNIKLELLKRIENDYNDEDLNKSNIVSATAIRKAVKEKLKIDQYVPNGIVEEIIKIDDNKLLDILKYRLIVNSNKDNEVIFLGENGQLIQKIKKVILNTNSIEELVENCKDRNNSKYKIKRILMNIILNIKSKDYENSLKLGKNNNLPLILGVGFNFRKEIKNYKISYNIKETNLYKFDLQLFELINNLNISDVKFKELNKPIIKEK